MHVTQHTEVTRRHFDRIANHIRTSPERTVQVEVLGSGGHRVITFRKLPERMRPEGLVETFNTEGKWTEYSFCTLHPSSKDPVPLAIVRAADPEQVEICCDEDAGPSQRNMDRGHILHVAERIEEDLAKRLLNEIR